MNKIKSLAGLADVSDFAWDNEVAVLGIMEKEGSDAHLKFKEAAEADFGRAYGVTYDDEVKEPGMKLRSGSRRCNPRNRVTVTNAVCFIGIRFGFLQGVLDVTPPDPSSAPSFFGTFFCFSFFFFFVFHGVR